MLSNYKYRGKIKEKLGGEKMVTFDINGAIVEFDEKMNNYNSIRKLFKNQAEYARDNFKNYCLDNILTAGHLTVNISRTLTLNSN